MITTKKEELNQRAQAARKQLLISSGLIDIVGRIHRDIMTHVEQEAAKGFEHFETNIRNYLNAGDIIEVDNRQIYFLTLAVKDSLQNIEKVYVWLGTADKRNEISIAW